LGNAGSNLLKISEDICQLERVENLETKWFLVTILAVFSVALATTLVLEARATTTRNFTLYGSSVAPGWGFIASNITSPGPTIVVEQGDTVNLTLTSNDHNTHQFFVSYTNDTSPIVNDPQSLAFSTMTAYSFTATNTVGTYTYRCYYHPDLMWGYFKVVPTGSIPEFEPLMMTLLSIVGIGIVAFASKRRRRI
jgi:heme/copper-type cytochrome/quinol oxidase subunit 2